MRILHILSIAAASVTACSSTSVQQACTDLTTAICNELSQCEPSVLQGAYGSTTTCETRTQLSCESSLSLKNNANTPDQSEKCAKAYASLSCADFSNNNLPASCNPPQPGKIADGAACGVDGQCASNHCQLDPKTGCGKCIEPVPAGQSCKSTADCASGLECAASSVSDAGAGGLESVCVAPAPSGGTCSTTLPIVPCQAGLLCSKGTCVAPLAAGAACNPAAPLCDAINGYFCTPVGTRCQLALWAGTGGACGYDAKTGDLTLCSGSGFCGMVNKMTGLGTCQAPGEDNASCDVLKGPYCMPPAYCNTANAPDGGTNGVCTLVDPSSCAGGGADGG